MVAWALGRSLADVYNVAWMIIEYSYDDVWTKSNKSYLFDLILISIKQSSLLNLNVNNFTHRLLIDPNLKVKPSVDVTFMNVSAYNVIIYFSMYTWQILMTVVFFLYVPKYSDVTFFIFDFYSYRMYLQGFIYPGCSFPRSNRFFLCGRYYWLRYHIIWKKNSLKM